MDDFDVRARLTAMRADHRDLDASIAALRDLAGHDQIQLARLKKQKLRLRDEIETLHDMLVPDIIA